MQYESQIFSTIGKDNKTAEITVSLSDSALTPKRHQLAAWHGEKH